MVEVQQSPREAVHRDAIGTAVDVNVTRHALDRFQKGLNEYAARHNYFADSVHGKLKTPEQIYEATQNLSVVLIGSDGTDVVAPTIQKRNNKHALESSIIQLQAREFGMEKARLRAISQLAGNQDLDAALAQHDARYQKWLDGIHRFAARDRSLPSAKDTSGATGKGGRIFGGGALLATAAIVQEDASPRSRRIMRVVGPVAAASLLFSACAPGEVPVPVVVPPIIAPDSQPLNRPTKTDVPLTKTASPTPEASKTPEPTKELRPGIDTFVPVGKNLSLAFTKALITDNYYNPDIVDYHLNIAPGKGQTWLIIQGEYAGDFDGVFGVNGKVLQPNTFYLERQGGQNVMKFFAGRAGLYASKHLFFIAVIINKTDKGPYIWQDTFDGWQANISSILDTKPYVTPTSKP